MWAMRGALFVGAALAGLGLELVRQRPDLLLVPPILLLPFLSDVLLTIAWRARHGKKLFVAHRDHSYQIALKAGLNALAGVVGSRGLGAQHDDRWHTLGAAGRGRSRRSCSCCWC